MDCVVCNQLMIKWKRIISKMHCENEAQSAYRAVIDHRLSCEVFNERNPASDPLGGLNNRMIITSGFDFIREFSAPSPSRES